MSAPPKIAIYVGEFLEAPALIESYVQKIVDRFGDECRIVIARSRDEFGEAVTDADIAVCWNMPPEVFARAWRLRWISFGSAGIDHTTFPDLLASDVILTTLSGVHPRAIAEHVMSVILAFARRLPAAWAQQREHEWYRESISKRVIELAGASLGIVGAGRIGQEVARLGRAFGMRTSALLRPGADAAGVSADPERTPTLILSASRESPTPFGEGEVVDEGDQHGPGLAVFDRAYEAKAKLEFLAECDFLVLAMPLTKETEGFLDAEALAVMKPSAYLVNIARAGCIDEQALVAALREGRLAGAALDVFSEEPLPPDHPFWSMENVIITPHTAGSTPRYPERAFEIFSENMQRFRAGTELVNVYDRARGY
jgi:D-2-hydroxyacid dehydrogenase (NADP+)